MANKEISTNNPEKELIKDKSISDDKIKQMSKKNTTQNKKISPKNDKSNKPFDEISNNNPEKELIKDNSISVDKTKQISKKNTTQNKKITPKKLSLIHI